MNERSSVALLSELDAAFADQDRRPQLVRQVLERIRQCEPAAINQCAASIQLEQLGVAPLERR